jgi:hypothetical protein
MVAVMADVAPEMAIDRDAVMNVFPGEKVESKSVKKNGKRQWQITRQIGSTNTSQLLGFGATLAAAWHDARTKHDSQTKDSVSQGLPLPIAVECFHFREPGAPCAVWSSGEHIVLNGLCRCEKRFQIVAANG